ncbi:TPA: hypothetical protein U2D11_002121, partial [Streptococcus suis]|nr:hypothetical protein [Streptococcus suis]
WSVDLPEGVDLNAGDKVSVTQTETGKKESTPVEKEVDKTQAETIDIQTPKDPVVVGDKNKLTEPEKEKVKEAVNEANPNLPENTEVKVGENGDVT